MSKNLIVMRKSHRAKISFDPVVYYVQNRFSKNQNWLALVVGSTGSGKSYASLRIAEKCDPTFSIDNVVFSAHELMTLLNSGKLKKGSIIVFEETGVGLDAKRWNSVINKLMNHVLQTFRFMNIGIIFNTPSQNYMDKSSRQLLHFLFETLNIDHEKKVCYLKPLEVYNNPRTGDIWTRYLKVVTPNGNFTAKKYRVGLARKELLDAYEQKKKEFSDKLNKSVERELQARMGRPVQEESKELTEMEQTVYDLYKTYRNQRIVANFVGITVGGVKAQLDNVKRKGHTISKVVLEKQVSK